MKTALAVVAFLAGSTGAARIVSAGDAPVPADGTLNISGMVSQDISVYAGFFTKIPSYRDLPNSREVLHITNSGELWVHEPGGTQIRVGHFDTAGTWHFAPCK